MTDEETADVVVVGYGSAGAAAAIAAADGGARVVVLEKQPEKTHLPSSRVARIVMAVQDVDGATAYLDRCSDGMVPKAVSRAWAERARGLSEWLDRVAGLTMLPLRGVQHPDFEGADALYVYLCTRKDSGVQIEKRKFPFGVPFAPGSPPPDEAELFDGLAGAVAQRQTVRVLYDAPARRLLKRDGRVDGVEYESSGTRRRIRAERGVVLACGGYEFDEALKLNHLKAYPAHFYSTPANSGDGVRMAQDAGADLWHMNQMIGRGIGHFTFPDGSVVNGIAQMEPPGYVITDKHGRRFADEYAQARIIEHTFYFRLIEYDPVAREFPRIPCYWFFDRRRMDAGRLITGTAAFRYTWSEDNQDEVRRGWVASGPTIRDAAAAAGVLDPDEAARSVAAYNLICRSGADPFGRTAETLVPLDAPPYFCIPLYPGGPNTCGGPRRDEYARILDPFGDPIPGLYGAGELGEAFGMLYPSSGSNLSEALCFGQIAGEHATQGLRRAT